MPFALNALQPTLIHAEHLSSQIPVLHIEIRFLLFVLVNIESFWYFEIYSNQLRPPYRCINQVKK